jgi:hypothetical protein
MGMSVNIATVKSRVNAFIQAYSDSIPFESRVIILKLQANSSAFLNRYSGLADPEEFYNEMEAYLASILRTVIVNDANSRMLNFMDTLRAGYVSGGKIYPINLGVGKLNLVFKVTYTSALELSSANNFIAKIALRFNEPDPLNRDFINL